MVEELLYTNIEALVLKYLIENRINFQFQTSLAGGFFELGGAVVDFLLPDDCLAFRIMGEYFHKGTEKSGSDTIQREMLTNLGYTVVDLWSSDLEDPARLEETMKLALQGQEMLR